MLRKSSPKTSKYLQGLKNNSEFWAKLRFFRLCSIFNAESGVHSLWRVTLRKTRPKTSKYLQGLRNNSEFRLEMRFSRL
jgi:hypothetical protein